MAKIFILLGYLLTILSGNVQSASLWVSAFDNTANLPTGSINHNIDPETLTLEILGLRFYRVDGGGSYVELDPYLGIGSTLQNHFDQAWSWTGSETDNYKFISIDTGSRLNTFYIADDHDIVNPAGGSHIRQIQYTNTPMGLITSGYNTGTYWLDHGAAVYGTSSTFGSHVYRLDILAEVSPVPLPATLWLLISSLGMLGIAMPKRAP